MTSWVMLAPQVFRDRGDKMMGIVDFATKDDMKYALRKLDDTEFKNPFDRCANLESYITLEEASFYRVLCVSWTTPSSTGAPFST